MPRRLRTGVGFEVVLEIRSFNPRLSHCGAPRRENPEAQPRCWVRTVNPSQRLVPLWHSWALRNPTACLPRSPSLQRSLG